MTKQKITIQNNIYKLLIDAEMNEISARFVAFKLVEKNITSLSKIKQIKNKEFLIYTSIGKYLVVLPKIPIPDAKISLV